MIEELVDSLSRNTLISLLYSLSHSNERSGKMGSLQFYKEKPIVYSYTNLEKSSIYLEKEHLPYPGNDILYAFAFLSLFNFPADHNSKYIIIL